MQGGKGAVASVMEAAANVAASAKSGMDKTKAVVGEKVERMYTSDEVEKDMATLRKEEKIDLAELRKCKAYAQNAAAAVAPPGAISPNFTDGGGFETIGSYDKPAAIISSNADHGSPLSAANNFVVGDIVGSQCPVTGQVGSETNSPGNLSGTPVVDSNLNPTHTMMSAQVVQPSPTDNSNPTGMPAQVDQPSPAVNSNPDGMPGQVVQPVPTVDSNTTHTCMPEQVVQPVGSG